MNKVNNTVVRVRDSDYGWRISLDGLRSDNKQQKMQLEYSQIHTFPICFAFSNPIYFII